MRFQLYESPHLHDTAYPEVLLAALAQLKDHVERVPIDTPPAVVDQFSLVWDQRRLALLAPGYKNTFSLSAARLQVRSDEQSLLARACGADGRKLRLLDPFAGFGFDGLALSHLGCEVRFVEQHPLVWLLLVEFAWHVGAFATALQYERQIQYGNALDVIRESPAHAYDVVYLDPMFAQRRKQALPNRGLQHLQVLTTTATGSSLEIADLIEISRRVGRRVVLKRRRTDPLVGNPTFQLSGKSVRFDVFQQ